MKILKKIMEMYSWSITSCLEKPQDEWILDTGCSEHMCPNRDWFSSYKSVKEGLVKSVHAQTYKVVGVGTIKIKVHDGSLKTCLRECSPCS